MTFVVMERSVMRSARNVGIGQKSTRVVRINAVANLNHTEKGADDDC
jgi:hypothetical protein